jgi:hypothetical protein
MTQDINFFYVLDGIAGELPPEFSGYIQVQNISGSTMMVMADTYLVPRACCIVHPDNQVISSLLSKKLLKVRHFSVSDSVVMPVAAEAPKKKRKKKGQSTSSPLVLEGAVADLAAVISGAEQESVATEEENVEQLLVEDSESAETKDDESNGEGSPETDSQSV